MNLSTIFFISFIFSVFAQAQDKSFNDLVKLEQEAILTCQNWTKADWDNYIQNKLITKSMDPRQVTIRLDYIRKACQKNFDANNINKCVQRVDGYSKHFLNEGKGMFSAIKTDQEYWASLPPEAASLPAELKDLPRGLPKNWKEMVLKNGWQYVHFSSDTGDSARLVIRIPGEKYDRLLVYFSFNSKNADPSTYTGVQQQVIEKGFTPPKYYFNSFSFAKEDEKPYAKAAGGRCVTCHSSGPRAIVPNSKPTFPTTFGGVKSVDEFNKLMVLQSPPDLSPYYDLKNFPTHLKVGQDCKSCHDGQYRSSLALNIVKDGQFYENGIARKIMDEKTMPMGDSDVSNKHRKSMLDETAKDYQVQLKKWLTEVTCVDQPGSPSSPTRPTPAKTQN